MRSVPYLTFAGNAKEAMTFYHKCLGGKLQIQKIGDSPLGKNMPKKMKGAVLHASLAKKNMIILATDMVGENGLQKGNSFSIMLNCESESEIRNIYKKLSRGGKQTHPVKRTFFGSLIGDLIDKYGNTWILHYKLKTKKHESNKDHFLDNYEYHLPF